MIERTLLQAARELRARGEETIVATVVRVRGSAYRRPGARMLITRDRWIAGSVSGGCLEGDILRRAWWLTERSPALLTYDSSVAEDASNDELRAAFGLGCGGVVDILLERTTEPLARIDGWLTAQQSGVLGTVFAPSVRQVALDADGTLHGQAGATLRGALEVAFNHDGRWVCQFDCEDVLIETIRPTPRLFVFGTGHDVVPVVQLAQRTGWYVVVCTKHGSHGVRERFRDADEIVIGDASPQLEAADDAFALVMSHNVDVDREHLAMLVSSPARYIGVLGPLQRTQRLLAQIGIHGDPRLHAPVGLALGAEGPEQIALSIVAELQAVRGRAQAMHLREHEGPIHARAS
jgi:xanthine dehydrogenase accessory factor